MKMVQVEKDPIQSYEHFSKVTVNVNTINYRLIFIQLVIVITIN